MINVASSDLSAVGYNERLTVLRIRFRNGTVYDYYDVPETVYNGLLDAVSKGTYDLANCYGIEELKTSFDFSEAKADIIYAPNGTIRLKRKSA